MVAVERILDASYGCFDGNSMDGRCCVAVLSRGDGWYRCYVVGGCKYNGVHAEWNRMTIVRDIRESYKAD
jgi:hypothetical protein